MVSLLVLVLVLIGCSMIVWYRNRNKPSYTYNGDEVVEELDKNTSIAETPVVDVVKQKKQKSNKKSLPKKQKTTKKK